MATHIPTGPKMTIAPMISTPVSQPSRRVSARSEQATVSSDWKQGLPVIHGAGTTLRELRISDAAALLALLTTEEVTRFISPPPTTIEGFERFIRWVGYEREAGRYLCFAVVPDGYEAAVGLFQIRQLDPMFGTAEWGFAIASTFWGSGLFANGAALVIEFAFKVIGVHRFEARAAVQNGRGNGALRKIGAVQEGVLRRSFLRGGMHFDQALWAITEQDYRSKAVWGAKSTDAN